MPSGWAAWRHRMELYQVRGGSQHVLRRLSARLEISGPVLGGRGRLDADLAALDASRAQGRACHRCRSCGMREDVRCPVS